MNLRTNTISSLVMSLAAASAIGQITNAVSEPKKSPWENSVSVGLTLTKGNSDTLLGTANWLSTKKFEKNELRLGADGTYGEADGVRNAQSLHGFGQYNHLFTERMFGYLRADGYHDSIADITYRFVLSPGVGYYFVKNAQTQLSGEVGPGWVLQKKGDKEESYLTLRVAERFEHKFNDRAKVWQSLEFLPQVDDLENYIVNAEIGVDSALTKKLSLRVFVQDTYNSRPAPGRKENDVKLVTALAYKF